MSLRDEYPFMYLVIQPLRTPYVCTDPSSAKLLIEAGVEVWSIDGLRRQRTTENVEDDIVQQARQDEWVVAQAPSKEQP